MELPDLRPVERGLFIDAVPFGDHAPMLMRGALVVEFVTSA